MLQPLELPQFIPAQPERFQVAAARYEIMFTDCSTIGLHQVWHQGAPIRLLRALRHGKQLIVFDLSKLAREFRDELPIMPQRDVPGFVFYALRAKYSTKDLAIEAMLSNPVAVLTDADQVEELAA